MNIFFWRFPSSLLATTVQHKKRTMHKKFKMLRFECLLQNDFFPKFMKWCMEVKRLCDEISEVVILEYYMRRRAVAINITRVSSQ